jgi:hypothetical protein
LGRYSVRAASELDFRRLGERYLVRERIPVLRWALGLNAVVRRDPSLRREHRTPWTSKDTSRFGGGLNFYAYCYDDPINFIDPTGFEPGRTYDSPLGAALAAFSDYNAQSVAIDREITGLIYAKPGGGFSYSPGRIQRQSGGTIKTSECPSNSRIVGFFHTHGSDDPNFDNEAFSDDPDKIMAQQAGKIYGPEFRSYLATPHGFVGVYNPSSDSTNYGRFFGSTGGGWHP